MAHHTKETMELIKELVSIPSPSGNTAKIINFIENYVSEWNVETKRNNKGALILTVKGKNDAHRLLTAHVDTLGAMVKEIKPDGRLSLSMIGGFRWNSVEGNIAKLKHQVARRIQERF